jgi:hypothetical protein
MTAALLAAAVVGCDGVRAGPRDGGSGGAGAGVDAGAGTTIVVTTPSGGAATESKDGHCDLLEAVQAANTDRAVNECPAGRGADRIVLTAGATYPLAKTLRITAPLSLGIGDGGGEKAHVTAAASFTSDLADRWSQCLVHAAVDNGTAKVSDLVLSPAATAVLTGACVSFGSLQLRRSEVTGFRKGGVAVVCLPEAGCDHEREPSAVATLALAGSLVSDNRSPDNGGGLYSEGSGAELVVEHSAIIDNVANGWGGGLYFGGGWNRQRIEHSTISGNAAQSGAGVFVGFAACTATSLYVSNSTITRNIATDTGGGVEFHGNVACYPQDVIVRASIITGNTSTTSPATNINAVWSGGLFACDRGSLIHVPPGLPLPLQWSGRECRFDLADALLAPLARMGGAGNLPVHVPRPGSPAIDAASDDPAPDQQRDGWIPLFDQDKPPPWAVYERVVDGDGDGVEARDLGAYEVNDVWQTELLALHAKGSGGHAVVTTPEGYERGAGTAYADGGTGEQFVTYAVPIAEAGSYALTVRVRKAADAGQFQAAVAEAPGGPWTDLGPVQDTYEAADAFASITLAASHTFAAPGQKLVRFAVVGKNPASGGNALYFDSLRLTPLP